MEPKLRIIRKKKSEAENAHLDPLMRALKALHSALSARISGSRRGLSASFFFFFSGRFSLFSIVISCL